MIGESRRLWRRGGELAVLPESTEPRLGKGMHAGGVLGGADSVALVLALAAATDRIVVGHVVHDLRTREEVEGDRDFVRDLTAELGLSFVERAVKVRSKRRDGGKGNLEALARAARYDALVEMAAEAKCRFVATAHHADDQVETLLMGIMRGVGLVGLSGMAESRLLGRAGDGNGKRVWLIRPMIAAEVRGGVTARHAASCARTRASLSARTRPTRMFRGCDPPCGIRSSRT